MKHALVLVIALVLTTGFTHAQKVEKAKTETKETVSMVCPVTGEDADPDVSYAYNGKTYYFCCPGCVTKFKKEPTKFIKASAKGEFDPCDHHEEEDHASDAKIEHASDADKVYTVSGAVSEKAVINEGKDLSDQIVNAKCPVMGKPVSKKVVTVTYDDKVYGFCCKGCIKKFADNPQKYLKSE